MPNTGDVRFKTEEIKNAWPSLFRPLRVALLDLAEFVNVQFGIPSILVTCLDRTPDQNTAVGGQPKSFHMTNPCRAADLRRRGFTDDQAMTMKSYFVTHYPPERGWAFVIEGPPHNDKAPHFHIQANMKVKDV